MDWIAIEEEEEEGDTIWECERDWIGSWTVQDEGYLFQ
jgi:hypothetical protein